MSDVVFVTGASGCIGHYVLDGLLERPDIHIHLLVRDASKLKRDLSGFSNVQIHVGDLETIESQKEVLATTTHLIHLATAWGDSEASSKLNVDKSLEMLGYCDPARLKRVVYFSTASILGEGNRVLPEAETLGTGYIRSKVRAYLALKSSTWADRMITLFPTLVFGGDATHPFSHISGGLMGSLSYAKWVRFLYMDAHFHFMHAKDIASVTMAALDSDQPNGDWVTGQPVLSGREAIEVVCRWAGVRMWFRFKVTAGLVFKLAGLFKIKISSWDRFCIEHPHFRYQVVSPSTFSKPNSFPTLLAVLDDIKQQTAAAHS